MIKYLCMKAMFLECGRVCGAHGVRGVLKVEPWCDSPRVLAAAKRVFLSSGEGEYREHKVLGASVNGPGVLLTIEGVSSRDEAIAMRDTVLYLAREDIKLKPGQMFLADMVGLSVIDAESGRVYGSVVKVEEAPRGLLYSVKTEGGIVLYPSGEQFIKEIDPERGMIITPIPGFFD